MNTNTVSKLSFKQVLAVAIVAVSLPATIAFADNGASDHHDMKNGEHCERGDRAHHGMGEPGVPPYLHGLQLTSAQEDKLFAITYPQIPTMRDAHKQHRQLMEELRATAQADTFDDAKAQQLADKAAALEKEKVLMMARNDAKIFALLTPEQRNKARKFKMGDHWHNHSDDGHNQPSNFRQRALHQTEKREM